MFNYQRTLANSVSCQGIGLHSGIPVHLTLHPAEENTGIVFKRLDIDDDIGIVNACYSAVSKTTLGTTLRNEHGAEVSTIEHLMAAFWGSRIDNCLVEIDGAEVPIMDGSSSPFTFLIECAGKKEQKSMRRVIEIMKPVRVYENDNHKDDGAFLCVEPSSGFSVGMEIDFGDSVIANQKCLFNFNNFSFKNDISRARTFGFAHEVDYLQKQGLAKGGSLENAIVVDKDKILNEETLRYNNEFVRHKVLDCIGDLYLAGGYVKGDIHGYKSGHALNNKLLRTLFADEDAWREVRNP